MMAAVARKMDSMAQAKEVVSWLFRLLFIVVAFVIVGLMATYVFAVLAAVREVRERVVAARHVVVRPVLLARRVPQHLETFVVLDGHARDVGGGVGAREAFPPGDGTPHAVGEGPRLQHQ